MRLWHGVMVIVSALCLGACDIGGDPYGRNDDVGYPGITVSSYEGTWFMNGGACGKSVVMVYDTGFNFMSLPSAVLLKNLLPEESVGDVEDLGYMVPYDDAGYTGQALYYSVNAERWDIKADINGRRRTVRVLFEPYASGGLGSVATYSKLSGVYKIVLQVRGFEIYDPMSGDMTGSGGASAELSFVTMRKV